jgi:hypothetical protein
MVQTPFSYLVFIIFKISYNKKRYNRVVINLRSFNQIAFLDIYPIFL